MPANVCAVFALCVTCLCVSGLYAHEPQAAVAGSSNHFVSGTLPACNSTANSSTICKPGLSDVVNRTASQQVNDFWQAYQGPIVRALIVFGTVTAIIIVYVSVRCIRARRRLNKSRKYGLIATPDDKLELKPLDDDDDEDEDMTVFDRTRPKSSNSPSGIRPLQTKKTSANGKRSR